MNMEEEETVECPYNPAHQIIPSRLQYHLVRCKRSYKDVDLKVCPFNSTHYLRKEAYSAHVSSCSSRENTEKMIYPRSQNYETCSLFQSSLPKPSSTQEYFHDGEDWESELVTKSYDPMEKCLKQDVPLLPRNLTKSEKKAFREKEIDRLTSIKEKEEMKKSTMVSLRHQGE